VTGMIVAFIGGFVMRLTWQAAMRVARGRREKDMREMIIAALSVILIGAASAPHPLIIAHRGASGTVPEHTLAAFAKAIDEGADYIEPDLVLTKDGVLVVRHENEISGTTNVAAHREFAARKTTKLIDGETISGWFTEDFTLAELKSLRARERLPHLRPDSAKLDGIFEIATFQEVIDLVRTKAKRRVGLYPETKHPSYFDTLGLSFDGPLLSILKANNYLRASDPIFIQSFEVGNLKRLRKRTKVRLIQLMSDEGGPPDLSGVRYAEMTTPAGMKAIALYANGVGVAKAMILPRDSADALAAPTTLVADAHKAGLKVHVWTFRAENAFLPKPLRSGTNPADHGDLASEVKRFTAQGIDGLFSDHPAEAVAAVRPSLPKQRFLPK
jgi:glycerophosphoryl diester phosphodiesterase